MYEINIKSFGYLHAEPPKADVTIDLRELLSDPAHRPEGDMLDMTGLDQDVIGFVFKTPGAYVLAHSLFNLIDHAAHIKPITLAIGCAGGRHRSVALATKVSWLLKMAGHDVKLQHLHVHIPRVIK